MEDGGGPNVWSFLSIVVSLVVAPTVMWLLNRKQTKTITANAVSAAQEVKTELQADAAVREVKLDAVHSLVNGDRLAKLRRIEALEAQVRDLGGKP